MLVILLKDLTCDFAGVFERLILQVAYNQYVTGSSVNVVVASLDGTLKLRSHLTVVIRMVAAFG